MSDFFTRLAERTLGLALIIQPIKPSLFAPELDAGGATPGCHPERSEGSPRPSSQTLRFAQGDSQWQGVEIPAQARSVATSAAQSQHARMKYTGPAVAAARPSTGNIPVETPIPSGGTLAAPSSSRDNGRGRVDVGVLDEGALCLSGVGWTGNAYRGTPTESHANEDKHKAPTAPRIGPLSLQNGGGREFTPAVHTLESAAQLHEQTISRHVVLGERTTRNSQSDVGTRFIASELAFIPTPQVRPEISTPEPAIQVTIGRVEVRAVTAPPTTTRSPLQPSQKHSTTCFTTSSRSIHPRTR